MRSEVGRALARRYLAAVVSASPAEQYAVDPCLLGGGEAGALMRSIDWSKNPLGPVREWPTTLRTTVGIMLASRFAMRILWGPELIFLHNDAYRPVLGASKYPGAMGSRTADSFAELWDVIGPMFRRVMAGEAVALDDGILPLDRNGYLEECFFTLSYSPLSDDHGGVGGVLGVVYETTKRVLAERRLRALRQIAAAVSVARTADEVCTAAARALSTAPEDAPFALFYLRQDDDSGRLVASSGVDDQPAARPAVVHAFSRLAVWPLPKELHAGPYPEPLTNAIVLPLQRPGSEGPYGWMVVGVSPRRALDAEYETFFELAREHVAAAIANAAASAYTEQERLRLQSFLQDAPAAIAVFRGPKLVFDLASARYCRIVGRRADEIVGKPAGEALPELATQGVWTIFEKIYLTGEPFAAREYPVLLDRKGDGNLEETYFDWIAQATRDPHGAIDGVLSIAIEVTEQVVARRSVEGSRQFLEGVVNQMPAGVIIVEASTGKTVLSNALAASTLEQRTAPPSTIEQLAEYPTERPDGRPYTAADLPIVRALAGELVLEEEVVFIRKDGGHRTLLVSAAPVYDAGRRLIAGVASFLDITERKHTELALRDSEERGRAIVAALEEGIVLRGADGTIRFANASAERLLGVTTAELAPEVASAAGWRAIHEDGTALSREDQPSARALRDGQPVSNAIMGIERRNAPVLWLSVNAQPLFDPGGKISGVVSSFFDITERRSADEERQGLLARAERALGAAETASRAKDEFLAIVSHELRNPLNAILGWTRMLRSGSLSDERSARALETIERNATNQAQLIEDLLDVSRVIAGKLPLDVQTVTFARVIEAAVDSARPAIEARGLRLTVVLDTEGVLSGDPARLQQIVWNLLTNATKFTPRGGSIRVVLRRNESHLELSVTDSGQGISPAFLDHVFDRFKQADPSTTRQHGGLGLGLAIAKNLVEMHGGTIEAHSDGLGHGATFIVRVPVAAMRRAVSPLPTRAPEAPLRMDSPPELQGLRVLVVDDEPDARDLVMAVLADCGALVTTAPSVAVAMSALEQEVPDVLLSDIGMPVEDGYSLIARIRAMPRSRGGSTPAACLTGYTTFEDRRRALTAGFNMHLAKPIEPSELIAVVANLSRMAKALRTAE